MKFTSINANFTTSEMKFMKDFNKINKDVFDNKFDPDTIVEEIDYLIKKIKIVVPENKSAMINMLNIMKQNVNITNVKKIIEPIELINQEKTESIQDCNENVIKSNLIHKIAFYFPTKICHKQNIRFLRNIYSNDKYNLKVLLPHAFKKISYDSTYINLIKKYDNIIFYKKEDLNRIVNDFDVIFIQDSPKIDFEPKKSLKIYFIHHGITSIFKNFKEYNNIFSLWLEMTNKYKNYYIISMCNNLQKMLLSYGCKKVIKTNSIPQIIVNDIFYEEQTKFNDCVVIFYTVCSNINKFIELLDLIKKTFPSKQIIIKCKSQSTLKKFTNNIINKYNLLIYSNEYHISQFFKCYLPIFINGGTSLIEYLKYNKKFILHFIEDNKYYQKFPITFNKLLISNNSYEFFKNLKIIKNDNYFDIAFENDIKQLMNFCIGSDNFSNFDDDFDKIIKI